MTEIERIVGNEERRREAFPVVARRLFMAHAGVSPLPRAAADAVRAFLEQSAGDHQESGWVPAAVGQARESAARLLGCRAREIALLGPTSLGLNLVANGLPWRRGDEVVYCAGDYPANVYPWTKLRSKGVKAVPIHEEAPGEVTWPAVEAALTERTRLVALATCHFLSGFRIDVNTIGRNVRSRGILFCLDGIQTLGAFPISVEHVDFLSADSHKWLLGPLGAGILYVRESCFERLEPTLLGSWNVRSPDFVAQERIEFHESARRYEPGALNVPGIIGMGGSLRLLLGLGIEEVGGRILRLRRLLLERLRPFGYRLLAEERDLSAAAREEERSGILSLLHRELDLAELFRGLENRGISLSLRRTAGGEALLRISPHFYNTEEEAERLAAALRP